MRFNEALAHLIPYRSGPSLDEIRNHYRLERIIRLGANECSEGPFPEVVEALAAAVGNVHRYPDGGCTDLRAALGARYRVAEENIIVGNGSCEILMLLGEALLSPGAEALFPDPSFVMYRLIALARQARCAAVPLRDHLNDVEAMARAVSAETRLVIVCNPNNPTGTYVEPERIRVLLENVPEETAVVLDEAYNEYVTSPVHVDTVPWLDEFPNLIILRTFSKIYGLAGLRVGYGLAGPAVIEALAKVRQPYNVNALAQVAATEALKHEARVAERRAHVARERVRLGAALDDLGLWYLPSETNFILVGIEGLAIPAPEVPQALLERGVMTRSGYALGYPGKIRVTVGSVEENDLFVDLIAAMK